MRESAPGLGVERVVDVDVLRWTGDMNQRL